MQVIKMKTKTCFMLQASCFMGALVGCANLPSVGPDYAEPEIPAQAYALPDAGYPTAELTATGEYKIAASNADERIVISDDTLACWWKRFDDPVLEMLVESAVTNNLSFRMTLERLDKANWELLGSYAAFLPKFAVGAGWSRNWYGRRTPSYDSSYEASRENGTRFANMQHYNAQSVALDGNWEVDIFGGNRRNFEASLALAEAAGWTVADAWIALTTEIGKQYLNLRTTQARIAVALRNLKLQSETYEILKSRFDSGIGDELAGNQCAYIVEQTRAAVPPLRAQEETLKNALAILAGRKAGEFEETLAALPEDRDWLLAPQKVAELPLDLVRARPDVKAAERRLAAQTSFIGVSKSQWFPKLYVSGQVGWQSKKGVKLFNADSFFATLGPSISWPIFQGGAIYANVKATEAAAREAALEYELAVDNAYAGVRNAYSAYTQVYLRYQSLQAAVKAASDAVAISQDLYKNGLKDFNNVLDAQRSLLQLAEQLVISRGQITVDLIDLYKELGGGLAVIR